MMSEQDQRKFIDEYNLKMNKKWNKKALKKDEENKDYEVFKYKERYEKNHSSHLQENKQYYVHPDTKNPIDGGSKVEWAYLNTTLYPITMHDKLTSKDFFYKKGVEKKYFSKTYMIDRSISVNNVRKLHKDNAINSLVIKPTMFVESKGVVKIDNINDKKYDSKIKCSESLMWEKSNPEIVNSIRKANEALLYAGTTGVRDPFKGTYEQYAIYEENLNPDKKGFLDDYKFWCVNGQPIFCAVVSGRKDGKINVAFIDEKKERLPLNDTEQMNMSNDDLKNVLEQCDENVYKEMLDVAKIASKGLPLVRIDFCLNKEKQPKFIEAQDLYNYHIHRITMDDAERSGNVNKLTRNQNNINSMAKKFHLDPTAFSEDKCEIYNHDTKKTETITAFEKLIGNLIDLTKIDGENIGDYPCGDEKKATQKEKEAKEYLKYIKSINKGAGKVSKFFINQCFKKLKNIHPKRTNSGKTATTQKG